MAGILKITHRAQWKRHSALVDEGVVLYVAASVLIDDLKQHIAELPAFMRPALVAQMAALLRDAAAGQVQRQLLSDQPVLS